MNLKNRIISKIENLLSKYRRENNAGAINAVLEMHTQIFALNENQPPSDFIDRVLSKIESILEGISTSEPLGGDENPTDRQGGRDACLRMKHFVISLLGEIHKK